MTARVLLLVFLVYRYSWSHLFPSPFFFLSSALYAAAAVVHLVVASTFRLRWQRRRSLVLFWLLHHLLVAVDNVLMGPAVMQVTILVMYTVACTVVQADFVPTAVVLAPSLLLPASAIVYTNWEVMDVYGPLLLAFPVAVLMLLSLAWHAARQSRVQAAALASLAQDFALSTTILSTVLPVDVATSILESSSARRTVIAHDAQSLTFVFVAFDVDRLLRDCGGHEGAADLVSAAITLLDELREEEAEHGEAKRIDRVDAFLTMYIAVLGRKSKKHAVSALKFALMARARLEDDFPALVDRVKIGVSSGRAVGGIAGSSSITYSYYGDAVNFASRMASLADWGQIQVSPTTYQQIVAEGGKGLQFEARGMVKVKGKGDVYVRILTGVDGGVDGDGALAQSMGKGEAPVPGLALSGGEREAAGDAGRRRTQRSTARSGGTELVALSGRSSTMRLGGGVGGLDRGVMEPEYLDKVLKLVPSLFPIGRTIEFTERAVEHAYRAAEQPVALARTRILLCLVLAMHVVLLIYGANDLFLSESEMHVVVGLHVGAILVDLVQILLAVLAERFFARYAFLTFALPIGLTIALTHAIPLYFSYDFPRGTAVYGISIPTLLASGLVPLKVIVPFTVSLFGLHVLPAVLNDDTPTRLTGVVIYTDVEQTQTLFVCVLVVAPFVLSYARSSRLAFAMTTMIEKINARVDGLVEAVLPPTVIGRLREMRSHRYAERRLVVDTMADRFVIATDLVGFTTMCSERKALDIFSSLSKLFDSLDALTKAAGGQKLVTIGDAYIATMPSSLARETVDLGRAMQRSAEHLGFTMRVGVAFGTLHAGLLGPLRLPVYRAWGAAYDDAQRLESLGKPGAVAMEASVAKRFALDGLADVTIVADLGGGAR